MKHHTKRFRNFLSATSLSSNIFMLIKHLVGNQWIRCFNSDLRYHFFSDKNPAIKTNDPC